MLEQRKHDADRRRSDRDRDRQRQVCLMLVLLVGSLEEAEWPVDCDRQTRDGKATTELPRFTRKLGVLNAEQPADRAHLAASFFLVLLVLIEPAHVTHD